MVSVDEAVRDAVRQRLTARLKKHERGLDTPCWEFQGAKDADGYGKIRVGEEKQEVFEPAKNTRMRLGL